MTLEPTEEEFQEAESHLNTTARYSEMTAMSTAFIKRLISGCREAIRLRQTCMERAERIASLQEELSTTMRSSPASVPAATP